ncbi:hypothetical protein GW16_14830 [Xanthomonas arboricola pv. celebensis]|nr:hypothetical protein GW16_14830 [Xanthomonas arboricola pv. celebensis]
MRRPGADDMQRLPELVRERWQTHPDRIAYRFFQGRGEPQVLTFNGLWQRASSLATAFIERGWHGQCVLLVCKGQQEFVVAFYACLLAGVVAVPTAPPRRQLLRERLRLLVQDSRAVAIICDFPMQEALGAGAKFAGVHLFDIREPSGFENPGLVPRMGSGHDLAFLQYTSGSTGDPKGVAVSHANLMANSEAIRGSMGMSFASSVLIGLPLFHDMGLVGGVVQSMFVGCQASFIPPSELVQYPERWLSLISTLRITTSGGPDFIYDLATREVSDTDLQGLDLSCWTLAFCGAEPIRARTYERFAARFAAAGFRPEAFYPCYGMAEATLFITGNRLGQVPRMTARDGVDVVCCGEPAAGTQLRIVDHRTGQPVAEGEIGEIWVRGSGVAQGYWMREALSREVFHARLSGEPAARYLRTGDLGWLEDGQLFVCGRLKDLIIVNGRNVAPQDIEESAESACSLLRRGGVAAFMMEHMAGGERLVIVAEIEREGLRQTHAWLQMESAIRAAVFARHGLTVTDIVFIRPGMLPRTSSGKVRRSQCRADHLAGAFSQAAAGAAV